MHALSTTAFSTAVAASALLASAAALAGNGPSGYPNKPVTLVVPFAPGGGSDNIARYIASRLNERMDGTVIVDNRAGAGTNIGNEHAARAKNDGYTLLFGQVTLAINPFVYNNLRYNVATDFDPVAHIANSPTVLLVNPAIGVKDLPSFVSYVKAHPNSVNYGSGGTGTSVHLAGHLFGQQAGLEMTHVPYRGSGPAMADLMGGQIQAIFDTAPSAVPQLSGNKVIALAVSGPKRLAAAPNVPTFAEAGFAEFDAPAWYGLMAPAGTPPELVNYLNAQVNAVLQEPETIERLAQLGSVPAGGSAADFKQFITKESQRWQAVVKAANASLD